ncbi:Sulfite exporter TauE/SafE [compost metagenome]
MGVGGGFILVPAMLYVLRMRASVVVGTSLFQIIITTAVTTILQAGRNQTVDIVLSTILLLGGVVGAQFGAKLSGRFRAEEMRAALGLIVLLVGIQMGLELFVRPSDLFLLAPGVGD